MLTLNYSLDILKYWFNNLEESLIVQDSSDIIWVFISVFDIYKFSFFFKFFNKKRTNIMLENYICFSIHTNFNFIYLFKWYFLF